MGQDLAKECGCTYGAEEDANEQRVEIDQSAIKPGTSGKNKAAARLPEQEEEQYSAPPPPAPAPAAGTAVAKPKPKPARDLRAPKLSMDKILSDLEGSEEASYSAAFSTMAGGQAVGPDNPALRQFLDQYSGVTDVDTELLKIASSNEAFTIDCSSFVMLLRMNPLNESEALESFLRLSGGGDQISAEDCRTGLFQIIQTIGGDAVAASSERIIDAAMVDAGLQVSMEQWVGYTKTVSRIVRLAVHGKAV
eukprot:symbB.v1.2.013808.t1/scaffold980.1/size147263/7